MKRRKEIIASTALADPLSVDAVDLGLHRLDKGLRSITCWNSFAVAQQGSVAVEFAFLGVFFVVVLAIILQVLLIDWQAKNLDEALQRAARIVYTGTFQNSVKEYSDVASKISKLKSELCSSENAPIFNCGDARISISLASSFANSSIPEIVDSRTRKWSSGFGTSYACGTPGAIVVLTAAVRQPVIFQWLSFGTSPFGDSSHLIQSSVVFRTEPYDETSSGGAC